MAVRGSSTIHGLRSRLACVEVSIGSQTMLRVHLEKNSAQDPWQVTYGWVGEEDNAGSMVCVDLGRCLDAPIGKVRNGEIPYLPRQSIWLVCITYQ